MVFFAKKRIVLVTALFMGTAFLSGCGTEAPAAQPYEVSLEIWGVFDDTNAYTKAINAYQQINPNIKNITYRKLPIETYKEDLINAMASGKGPDIFMVRNSWRGVFEDKTEPAPSILISEQEYRNRLVDVAASDFINEDNQIYGVPLSVDSLALYYNKDLFNIAGIVKPPETWDEVATDVKLLNSIDQFGSITRSGIALGVGANINRSSDILTALMMQSGSSMTDRKQSDPVNLTTDESKKAFDFYTKFSQVGSDVYSWNARQDYSIDAFYKGNLAMMINYSWQYDALKQKNAKLNIGVAPLPQFNVATPVNLANYWGYAVSKNKPPVATAAGQSATLPADPVKQNALRTFEAWQFLKFLTLVGNDKTMNVFNGISNTSQPMPVATDPSKEYLTLVHKPAARRDLLVEQKSDLVLSAFAYGNLIAKNWYQGDSDAADGILIDTIDSVIRGEKSWKSGFDTASSRINLLTR